MQVSSLNDVPIVADSLISLVRLVANKIMIGNDQNKDGGAHKVDAESQRGILNHFSVQTPSKMPFC